PSISWHARITVAPENAEKFLQYLKPCMDAVLAEKECVFFQVFQDPSKPGSFMFIENWNASLEWMKTVQFTKPYYIPYITNTAPLWLDRKFEIWERLPGANWASSKP
ncbi:hypothetical protein BU16DRAFT_420983, partial [Lophium mytilinum]